MSAHTPFRAAAAVAVAFAAGTAPRPSDPATSEPPAALTEFGRQAARLCTDVLNSHPMASEDAEPTSVLLAVVELDRSGGEPTDADLQNWTATLQTEVDRRSSIRNDLAALSSEDAAEQSAWDVIVSIDDPFADVLQRRLDLVEAGDWDDIANGFLPGSGAPDGEALEQALATLAIPESDCRLVYSTLDAGVDDEWHEFRSEAASACTTVWLRRADAGYDTDVELALGALVAVLEEDFDGLPDGVDAALDRMSAEWQLTTDDLTAVDATGTPVADVWQDIVAASAERVEVYAQRAEAIRSGDGEAMREAFAVANFEYPGLDFIDAGLERRCSGVRS